ncbi:MAG: tRNA (N6-isopentenyl adenosine(37)-C2)-methylthiotransferase MiaB [Patescibacteria group bacterium]
MKKNKTYYIITIGCQMNKSDSERIAGYLEDNGFALASSEIKANLVVLTTCGVRQSAEDRVYGFVGKIKKQNPKAKIILTGCLSDRQDVRKRLGEQVDVWLNINDLPKLMSKLFGERKKNKPTSYLKIKPKYNSKISAFVPIGNGCDNFCAYCVVPYARGREIYRPAQEILKEVKDLVAKGCKEIVLIAQNVNSYVDVLKSTGSSRRRSAPPQDDRGIINFSKLLKKVNDVPGNFWIRFATSHPKDMSDELIKTIANCQKVCQHIHLPAQAGDDKILSAMNRKYTAAHYKNLIKKIRKAMPEAAITTDIIVGFPGETKKQFSNTIKLFKEIKFDMAYIAQYSPRFGTAAFKLKDNVSREEKKRREEELMKILRKTALENNKKYLGKTTEVLVSGESKKREQYGYTKTNKNVKIKMSNVKSGEFVKVKITKVEDFGMEGERVA